MFIHRKNPFDPVGGTETPENVALNRRRWLKLMGIGTGAALGVGALGYAGWKRLQGNDEQVVSPAADADYEQLVAQYFPPPRDERFEYGRAETDRTAAARYTNFYEFSRFKFCWRYVDQFRPFPWKLEIGGLCQNPFTIDIDDFHLTYAASLAERQYRHRCVERWAMAIPWSGIPLATLLQDAQPHSKATHVLFVSFKRPQEAPHQAASLEYPWPYTEGLTLPEAMNDLTFLATGMYGKPLLKQHGAPVRLVVPWKYGFKSIKSVQRIEFVDYEPPTFWSTMNPEAYPFESNVDPDVPRPWPQHQERMLGTNELFATKKYNGYGEYVAELYENEGAKNRAV